MNQYAVIGLEDIDGNMYDLPIEDLFDPNDLNISDADYGLFYMDVVDNFKKYRNKDLEFNGFLLDKRGDSCIVGRYAMVCCANDMQRLAIKVKGLKDKMQLKKYYHIEGTLRVEKAGNGYSLFVDGKKATEMERPEQEFVSFS